MSLFKSIAKVLGGVAKKVIAPVVGGFIGGPVGAAAAAALTSSGSKLVSKGIQTVSKLPVLRSGGGLPVLPGLGSMAASAGGGMAGGIIWDQVSGDKKKRRRRKGLTAKDLSSFKRVARLVDKYARPVQKMRNYKPKKEF